MIFKDYYKILGLDTSKATNEEIKLAYREQAKKYHPDINSNNRFSEERFKDINEAYKTLSNTEKVRLLGQGKEGVNGGKNGDLFIKINIQNGKKYRLNGLDLYTDLKITPWEAALGTKVSINSIDETVSLCIPQGTESGEKVRIPNKGYKDGKGGRGDLVAEVKIMVPKNLNEEEKKLFEEFNKISRYNPREA